MDSRAPREQDRAHLRAACPDPFAHLSKAIRSIPDHVLDQATSGGSPTSPDEPT